MLERLTDILAGLPVNAILRERIVAFEKDVAGLTQRIKALEKENSRLKKEHIKMQADLAAAQQREEFIEHCGALFKRKAGGGYHLAVYCPVCQSSVGSFQDIMPFQCARCQWRAGFNGRKLASIMSTLPE